MASPFSGLIDDLRIHRRALTAGELQSLMNVSVGEAARFHIISYNDSVTIGRSDSATYFLELSPTLTVQPRSTAGSWRQEAMGDTPALFYGAIVGDIGNIGRQRVIASGGDGVVYAYDYTGAASTFAQMPFGVAADGEMHNGEVGPGRNDGVNRLYLAAANSSQVYEVSWVNGQWQASVMATLNGSTDIVIGYGRNYGTRQVYVSSMNGLTEFTCTGTAWQALTLSSNEPGWPGLPVRMGACGAGNRSERARSHTGRRGHRNRQRRSRGRHRHLGTEQQCSRRARRESEPVGPSAGAAWIPGVVRDLGRRSARERSGRRWADGAGSS